MAKEKRRWEPMREEKWITKSEMTESEWSGDFQFVQLADCQFGFFESDEDGGKDWTREVDQSLIAIRYINQLKPKFFSFLSFFFFWILLLEKKSIFLFDYCLISVSLGLLLVIRTICFGETKQFSFF